MPSGQAISVVYSGVVVDVCAGAAIQRKAETCRVVCLRHCLTFHPVWITSSLCLEQFSGMLGCISCLVCSCLKMTVLQSLSEKSSAGLVVMQWQHLSIGRIPCILTNGAGNRWNVFTKCYVVAFHWNLVVMEVAKLVCNDWTDVHERHL